VVLGTVLLSPSSEGLTDLHDIIIAIVRSALADEALASGLQGRIAEMESALNGYRTAPPNVGRSPKT
jgi:hypothetical protein